MTLGHKCLIIKLMEEKLPEYIDVKQFIVPTILTMNGINFFTSPNSVEQVNKKGLPHGVMLPSYSSAFDSANDRAPRVMKSINATDGLLLSICPLAIEILCLAQELIRQTNMEETPEFVAAYEKLKSQSNLDISAQEFSRRLRNVTTHNDKLLTSVKYLKTGDIAFNLGSSQEEKWVPFSLHGLLEFASLLLDCQKPSFPKVSYAMTNKGKMMSAIKNQRITTRNFDNYFKVTFGDPDKRYEMDTLEKQAMVNLLNSSHAYFKDIKCDLDYAMTAYLGLKNNIYNILREKIICTDYLINLYHKELNGGTSYYDFMKFLGEKGFEAIAALDPLCHVWQQLLTNALFVAVCNTDYEVRHYALQSLGLTEKECNKLRNSIVHGRYFHNYNMGFEFYDTASRKDDTLVHVKTLHRNSILRTIEKLTSFSIMKRERTVEYVNKQKNKSSAETPHVTQTDECGIE